MLLVVESSCRFVEQEHLKRWRAKQKLVYGSKPELVVCLVHPWVGLSWVGSKICQSSMGLVGLGFVLDKGLFLRGQSCHGCEITTVF